jgi:glycosyltransferase involved in cell wall biosynthesis
MRSGKRVTVATITAQAETTDVHLVQLRKAPTQNRAVNLARLILGVARLYRLVRRDRPDVIVAWLAVPTMLGGAVAATTGIPMIAALRNSEPERLQTIPWWLMKILMRLSLSRAAKVVANSATGLAQYRQLRLLPNVEADVIPNGIDESRFRIGSAEERAAARQRLGVGHDVPVVAYVGRDAIEKNLALLVKTIALVPKHSPKTHFIVIGLRIERLRELADDSGVELPMTVSAHPRMHEIESVYWAADALLLTSLLEGSPNVVHEARACGVAVVSTDCGDVRETMLRQDRVVSSDPESLAEALRETLAELHLPRERPRSLTPEGCAVAWANAIESTVLSRH